MMLLILVSICWPAQAAPDTAPRRRGELGIIVRAPDKATGAEVARLTMGTPAYDVDIRPGDVIEAINATFVARPEAYERIAGHFRAGDSCHLRLRRGKNIIERELIAAEFPREVSSVEVRVEYTWVTTDDGVPLRVVVTSPGEAATPRPAVILVGGIEGWPCDAFDQPQLAALAHELGRRGHGAIRFDARGIGDSYGGPAHGVSLQTIVNDTRSICRWAQGRAAIDRSAIFLFGIGVGGVVATHVTADQDGIAGLATWGTLSRPLLECMTTATRRRAELAGLSAPQVNVVMHEALSFFTLLLAGHAPQDIRTQRPELSRFVDSLGGYQGHSADFWRALDSVRYDRLFAREDVPVLVLYGANDYVSCAEDQINAAALAQAGRSQLNVELQMIPGVDQRMSTAASMAEAHALATGGAFRFDSRAVAALCTWMDHVQQVRADQLSTPGPE